MLFRILGPLEVEHGGRLLDLGRPKQRAWLAALLVSANRVVSADRLLEELWEGEPPDDGGAALQVQVSRLRKVLAPAGAPRLESRKPGYVLHVGDEELDSLRFERLVAEAQRAARSGRPAAAAERLRAALGLWRGPALADFLFAEFARADLIRLEELRLVALEEQGAAELALGRHAELVAGLRTLVADQPLREGLWRQLIVALYRCGRQADALRTFAEMRGRLGEELGIDPSPDLCRLEEDLLLQSPDLDWRAPAEEATGEEVPHNLPAPRSSLIGRDDELAELEKLLTEGRMVTIVGPGGVGKTRLGVEIARRRRLQHLDGVWLAELAPVRDGALVAQAVASALDVREEPGQPIRDTLVRAIGDRHVLVVLDNCEHVVDAAAALVDALLNSSPTITVLATSREPLRIEGETIWAAPSLGVPAHDDAGPEALCGFDAVRLFVERATAQGPFALSHDNVSSVAQLCRRLDGVPLAIELAAARARNLSPAQMVERLDDRFDLLTGGTRTAVSRHQTLRAAVDWSYDLLSEPERILFPRLSTFAGGFNLTAAEEVCGGEGLAKGQVLDILATLVDRSLVTVHERDGEIRYRLHETLRAYGAERLALAEASVSGALIHRYLRWFLSMAEDASDQLFGPNEAKTLERLDSDHANLQLALRRALDTGSAQIALRLAIALSRFWRVRGYWAEGRGWLEAALGASPEAPASLRAKAVAAAAVMADHQADFPAALRLGQEALKVAREQGDGVTAAEALSSLSDVAQAQGDYERSESLLEECLADWRASGAVRGFVSSFPGALGHLGWRAVWRGRQREATARFEEALAVAGRLQIARARGHSLLGLAAVAEVEGQLSEARRFVAEATSISEHLRDRRYLALESYMRGLIAFDEGDFDGATAGFQGALSGARKGGDRILLIRAIEGIARVLAKDGHIGRAATLFSAAAALREALPWPVAPVDEHWYEGAISRLRDDLGDQSFDRVWEEGRAMGVEEALQVAVECGRRG